MWRSGRPCVEKRTAVCGEVDGRVWRSGRPCVERWTAVCGEVDGSVWRSGRLCVENWAAVTRGARCPGQTDVAVLTWRSTRWQTKQKQLQIRAASTVTALVKAVLQKQRGDTIDLLESNLSFFQYERKIRPAQRFDMSDVPDNDK